MPSFVLEKISIPLVAVHRGETDFSFEINTEVKELSENRAYVDKLHVDVNVTVLGEDFFIKLAVTGDALLYCDRCGESFKRSIQGDVMTLFSSNPLKVKDAEGGEVRLVDVHAAELIVTQEIIDALFLAVPDKIICKESCKGLCQYCGINLNEASCSCSEDKIDPRWEALRDFNINK